MENKEVYEFCEDNAITIGKFLQDNFEVEIYHSKTEKSIASGHMCLYVLFEYC